MLQQDVYISQKKVQKNIILCSFLFLSFLGGLWYVSGSFFTQDDYEPALVLILLPCLVIIFSKLLKEIRFLSNTSPFTTVLNEGVVFYEDHFDQIGLVKWKDIEHCDDFSINNFFHEHYLMVYVKNPEYYSSRIKDKKQLSQYFRASKNNQNALLWVETKRLDLDVIEIKKIFFQMIEANKKN